MVVALSCCTVTLKTKEQGCQRQGGCRLDGNDATGAFATQHCSLSIACYLSVGKRPKGRCRCFPIIETAQGRAKR